MPNALSTRYARALVDAVVAPAAGLDPKQSLVELRTFSLMMRDSVELRNVLLSPAVSITKKRAVVGRFAESMGMSRLVRNFLFLVIDRRRTDILEDIADAFELALDERMGIVRAEVKSAAPLTEAQQAELQQQLSRVSGKQVRGEFSIDPELIGGVVARIGSTVYDGSVRTQLQNMRERLVAR
ncbi:MAG TPA: ATP synthase F1 subunit delta [Bryobacteraceae bacterium]|nr:ATP synthase F1 subunit delta [Bryobacteraceae bacterium]